VTNFQICVVSLVLGLAGCTESRLAREEQSASRRIDSAEETGASPESLTKARASLVFAQESEARAAKDLETGRAELSAARERLQTARMVANEKVGAVEAAEVQLVAAERDVAKGVTRQAELRKQGVSEKDVRAATEVEVSRAKERAASMTAARDTARLEAPLAELECEAILAAINAAETKIGSAEQRVKVARSLYAHAEQQAKAVEMEALAGQKEAIGSRMRE